MAAARAWWRGLSFAMRLAVIAGTAAALITLS